MSNVDFTTFATFTRGTPAPALALELRDSLMGARDLASDFDAAGAVAATKDIYWLCLAAAALELMAARIAARFAPVAVAAILDELCAAVDTARAAAAGNASWLRAIDTAWGFILESEVLYFDAATHALRVESATRPGTFYTANGECQCEAFTRGKGVCWHRAAARLIRRALAPVAAPLAAPAPAEVLTLAPARADGQSLAARIAAARSATLATAA